MLLLPGRNVLHQVLRVMKQLAVGSTGVELSKRFVC